MAHIDFPSSNYFIQNGKYENEFEEIEKIEETNNGQVFKVRNKRSNEISSIKIIHLTPVNEKTLRKKLEVLSTIKNVGGERVIQHFNVWLENNLIEENGVRTMLYIQLQLFDKTLSDILEEIHVYLRSNETKMLTPIGFYIASQLFTEILEGVNHLHKNDPPIIHRNLSPNNIKVINNIGGNSIKIGDFDSAAIHQYSDQSHTRLIRHSTYIAPEVERDTKYDTKADIYSLGKIFQELFLIDINREYSGSSLLMKKFKNISNLLVQMMEIRYKERPDCEKILKDKSLYTLSADEFNLKEDFKNAVKHNGGFKESFVYQLIIYKWIIGLATQFEGNYIRKNWAKTEFNEVTRLGKGSFGEVFEATNKSDNKSYAIKVVKIKPDQEYEFVRELENFPFITELNDEKFVKYYDFWLEETSAERTPLLYIQMEKCDTSLKNIIEEIKDIPSLNGKDCLTLLGYHIFIQIFIEILEAVNHLHKLEQPIIHRDLNPDNILLKFTINCKSFIKIADFGLACIHKHAEQQHTADRGHIKYMAPEVSREEYDTRADIHSLGIIMEQDLFKINLNREYAENENQSSLLMSKYRIIKDLSERMTRRAPKHRPENIDKILSDKNLWLLNEDEFDAQIQLENFSCLNDKPFVYKLLRHLFSNE